MRMTYWFLGVWGSLLELLVGEERCNGASYMLASRVPSPSTAGLGLYQLAERQDPIPDLAGLSENLLQWVGPYSVLCDLAALTGNWPQLRFAIRFFVIWRPLPISGHSCALLFGSFWFGGYFRELSRLCQSLHVYFLSVRLFLVLFLGHFFHT